MANMNFPWPVDPVQTGITLAYSNRAYIADLVLPRTPVAAREFEYKLISRDQMFTIPETMVGRKGQLNEVEFGGTETAASVRDYGLSDVVPNDDIETARNQPGWDPIALANMGLTELIALDREKRVADLVFNVNTYPATNRSALSGTNQWSDFTNSDPYTAIRTALDGMLQRPNIGVIGRLAWSRLRVHPKITAALAPSSNGNSPTANALGSPASTQAVAELLELDQILVGEAFVNTAKPGQTASLARVWGKNMAFLHQNPAGSLRGGAITFGLTAQYGTRVAGVIDAPEVGLRGGQRLKVGESVNEIIMASDVGYYFSDVVA